jgi:putative ABC transport system substrate-binding protein
MIHSPAFVTSKNNFSKTFFGGIFIAVEKGKAMNRKLFWIVMLLLLTAIALAEAQQGKVYRIGVLAIGDIPQLKGFRDGLKNAGYVEGKNLVLDISVKQNYDEIRPIAKAYVERKLDVIVGTGTTAPLLAKELTQDIPILFVGTSDPIASGLVKSLAHPEANVTGVSSRTDFELHGKRLEIFKEAVPSLRRVAVLYNARGENPFMLKVSRSSKKLPRSYG